MLKKLSAERNLYETKMMMIENNVFEDYVGREIVEHWNEDQIVEWKSNCLYFLCVNINFYSYLNNF